MCAQAEIGSDSLCHGWMVCYNGVAVRKKLLPFPHLFKRKEWSLSSLGSNSDINYKKIVQASDTEKNYVAQMANATLEQESPYWHSLVSPQSLCWHLRTLFLGINLSLRYCKERPELSETAWRFCPRSQSLEDRYCSAEQSYPRLPVCLSVLFFRACSFIINSFNIYHDCFHAWCFCIFLKDDRWSFILVSKIMQILHGSELQIFAL